MNYKNILIKKSKNEKYVDRYLLFMHNCKLKNETIDLKTTYTEKHHILPKSDFPECKDLKENIIVLTGRQHFLAHWMLAKAISSNNMWFAFNQMRRLHKKSILYEYSRIFISKAISNSNTGKVRSQEFKDNISERFKGKQFAKYSNKEEYFWVDPSDYRWYTGEIIHASQGREHTEETKSKIGESNKGKSIYINEQNKIKMFKPDEVPVGFIPYSNPKWFEPSCENTIWCHNPLTETELRIKNTQKIPKGYIKGRNPKNHHGWKNVNNKHTVLHVWDKIYVNIDKSDFDIKIHYNINGNSILKLMVMVHENNVIIGYQNMIKYCNYNNLYLRREELKSKKIKNPHHNNSEDIYNFRKTHSGKHISELGIDIIRLEDFMMKPNYILWGNKI
jgi:hypothetical protein